MNVVVSLLIVIVRVPEAERLDVVGIDAVPTSFVAAARERKSVSDGSTVTVLVIVPELVWLLCEEVDCNCPVSVLSLLLTLTGLRYVAGEAPPVPAIGPPVGAEISPTSFVATSRELSESDAEVGVTVIETVEVPPVPLPEVVEV